MKQLILEKYIRPQEINVEVNGIAYPVKLSPNITCEVRNGIYVVRYGSIDFPNGPLPRTNPFTSDMQIYYPVVEAFSHNLAEILHQTLHKKQGKVLVRGVSSGDLEKTIEEQTDRWDQKDALANLYEGNPRQYTFAWPSQDSNVDSLRNALNPGRYFPAVGPIYRLLGGRLVEIDAYEQVRRFFRFDGKVYPNAREDFDKRVREEAERATMILVFDGGNATVVPNKAEGYGPYKFEGNPHLLAIVQFDLNYPRSVSRIDRGLLFKALEDYMQWLRTDVTYWKMDFYRNHKKGPVRFRIHGNGVRFVYDKFQDAENYDIKSFKEELSEKQLGIMNNIRPVKQ